MIAEPHTGPRGLGGWLIVPGMGVIINTVLLPYRLWVDYTPYLGNNIWHTLTSPSSSGYLPYFGPLLISEFVIMLGFFLWTLVLLHHFFAERRAFPLLFKWYLAAQLIVLLTDGRFVHLILPNEVESPFDLGAFFGGVVGIAIWWPYMDRSVRVRNTFIN